VRVLVTGAGGYLGSVLVPALLDRGHAVTALDLWPHGPTLAPHARDPRFTPVQGDIRDSGVIAPLAAGADIIIPLAAIVGAPACAASAVAARSINEEAIIDLLGATGKMQWVIFPNTNSGYGTVDGVATEETPLAPLSLYARTKADAEAVVMDHENSVSLRLATVFGASPRPRLDLLVNDFTWRALHDRSIGLFEPHFRRNFVHVRDVARAFLRCLDNWDQMKGQVFNVGDSRANMDKASLCGVISRHVPGFRWFNLIGEDPDKRDYEVSNAKIEAAGWQPLVTLDDGIAELLKLYAMMGERGRYRNA
jgi:nucleoside-diphosphate-sugar epimerase